MRASPPGWFLANDLRFPELADSPGGRAELPPYHGLADFWHDYVRLVQPDYVSFLCHLAEERGAGFGSILELACGTGTLTERLAAFAPDVVGIDVSEAMLARARARCAALLGVKLVRADFRTFRLGRRFDAAVCAADSLNYVADVAELGEVFRRVAEHLRPGGVFVFDTETEAGMRALSGQYLHVADGDRRFAVRFSYDPARRTEAAAALVAEGVERHPRVPLDPPDVAAAARESGLRVDDYFARPLVPGRWAWGRKCFFVLSLAGAKRRGGCGETARRT